MDVLKEWLGRTIEQELEHVLDWRRKSDANNSQVTGQLGDLTFHDDGSNLRVKSTSPKVVQIIKFTVSDDEPLQAYLSDSINRVNATVSKDAVSRFTKKHSKRLTDGTIGGLLQLLDFEIVATPLGPRDHRVTLFVTDFKYLGGGGSGTYGDGQPRAIQDRPKTQELLQKLKVFREQESATQRDSSRHSPPSKRSANTSQLESLSQDGEPHYSQLGFATQVPTSAVPAIKSITSKVHTNSTHFRAPHQDSAVGALTPDTVSRLPERRTELTSDTRLLDLLQPKTNRAALPTNKKKGPTTEGRELLRVLKQVVHQVPGKRFNNGRPTPAQTDAPDLVPELAKKSGGSGSSHSPPMQIERAVDSSPQQPAMASTQQLLEVRIDVDPTETTKQRVDSDPSIQQMEPASLAHVTARDVNISKDQEVLLSGTDCWLPAEPGRRGPVANLPIAILQSLNRKTNLQARRFATSLPKRSYSIASSGSSAALSQSQPGDDNSDDYEPNADTASDGESDTPVSVSEWPPSRQPSQLPPDSSIETADVGSNSRPSLRRSSRILYSSPSAPSRRLNSQKRQESSGKSNEYYSSIESSIGNATAVPSSAGEDPSPHICPEAGCGRPYMHLERLESHIDSCHNATGSLRKFKCELGQCGKGYTSRTSLARHIRRDHPDRESRLGESRCGSPRSMTSRASTVRSSESKSTSSKGSKVRERDPRGQPRTVANYRSADMEKTRSTLPEATTPTLESISKEECLSSFTSPRPNILAHQFNRSGDGHLSSLHSNPSSQGSDIETTFPLPLGTMTTKDSSIRGLPSTAIQPMEPFTQVRRTPYVNGHGRNHPPPKRRLSASVYDLPSSSANSIQLEDVDHVTLSAPSIIQSGSSVNMSAPPVLDAQTSQIRTSNRPTKPAPPDHNTTTTSTMPNVAGEATNVLLHYTSPEENVSVHSRSSLQSRATRSVSMESPVPVPAMEEPIETLLKNESDIEDPTATGLPGSKRKVADTSFLSSNTIKRRKKFKAPNALDCTESLNGLSDPVEGAKRWRQDFLASRKTNEARSMVSVEEVPAMSITSSPLAREKTVKHEILNSRSGFLTPSKDTSNLLMLAEADTMMEILDQEEHEGIQLAAESSTLVSPNLDPRHVKLESTNVDARVESAEATNSDTIGYQADHSGDGVPPKSRSSSSLSHTLRLLSPSPMLESIQPLPPIGIQHALPINANSRLSDLDVGPSIPCTEDAVKSAKPADQDADFHSRPTGSHWDHLKELGVSPVSSLNPPASAPVSMSAPQSQPRKEVPSQQLLPVDMNEDNQASAAPVVPMSHDIPQSPEDTYTQFKVTYPIYIGDLKHFMAVCKKICSLGKTSLHHFLWDDFIIRHKIEYAQHLLQCAEYAEDALPYGVFYRTEIEKPLYMKRVVTPRNIEQILSQPLAPCSERQSEDAENVPPKLNKEIQATTPKISSRCNDTTPHHSKHSNKIVTISLLSDDEKDIPCKTPGRVSITPLFPNAKRRRTGKTGHSHGNGAHQKLAFSSRNSAKPMHSNHSREDSGRKKEVGEVRENIKMDAGRQSDLPLTGNDLKEAWGVGVGDVLDPLYCDDTNGQHLKVLRDISKFINLQDAGRLLHDRIYSRIARDPGSPRALTAHDLEAVYKAEEEKSRCRKSLNSTILQPEVPDAIQIPRSKRVDEQHGDWWRDANTPFRNFAKVYSAIRNGHGNSYAAKIGRSTQGGDADAEKRNIDPLIWNL